MHCCYALLFTDNTASVLTMRGGFQRHDQTMYRLPVLIMDGGSPALSSTNTLSIRVCDCDPDGAPQSCGSEASMLSAGLSTGSLIAILACILTLLGMRQPLYQKTSVPHQACKLHLCGTQTDISYLITVQESRRSYFIKVARCQAFTLTTLTTSL